MTAALTGTAPSNRSPGTIPPPYTEFADRFALPVWQTRLIVFTPIVGTTLLGKFGVPPLAGAGLGILYPLTFMMLAYGFLTAQLQFDSRRLVFFFVMMPTLGLIQVLRQDPFSHSSFLMMAALTCTYVFTTRTNAVTSADALRFFCNLTAFIAVLGILQFVVQFAGNDMLTFPVESFLPESFQTKGYNNVAPLYYGSPLYRSSAFVMLEPSVFSQICAIGLLAELAHRSRYTRLGLYVIAMIVAYSGTGIMILAVALPIFLLMERRWKLLGQGVVLIGLVLLLAEPLNLNVITSRLDEFSATGSSGFARFVGWQDLFSDRLWPSPTVALFGNGAGSFSTSAAGYKAAEMAFTKILFEFGIVGGLLYFGYVFFCVFSNGAHLILRIAIAVCCLMNAAYSPTLTGLVLSLLLWPNSRVAASPEVQRAT